MKTRPPLLCLGGEQNEWLYRDHFDCLYRCQPVTDILGNRVEFRPGSCRHVCRIENGFEKGRGVWTQARAERIPWIKEALCSPFAEVRVSSTPNRILYLLNVDSCPEENMPPEFYLVVTERQDCGIVSFITGYSISHRQWKDYRRLPGILYRPTRKKGGPK